MTEPPAQQPPEQRVNFEISPDTEAAPFADFVGVWHTHDVFVLDFGALKSPPQIGRDEDSGQPVLAMQARIVSRIRVPPGQVFELMRALEMQLSQWELETGNRKADPDS